MPSRKATALTGQLSVGCGPTRAFTVVSYMGHRRARRSVSHADTGYDRRLPRRRAKHSELRRTNRAHPATHRV